MKKQTKVKKEDMKKITLKLESVVLAGQGYCERLDKPISINRFYDSKCWIEKGENLYCQYFNQKTRREK